MYSIILTTMLLANNSGQNSSYAVSVNTSVIGNYSSAATCSVLARALSKKSELTYAIRSETTAQCVQVKDK